KADIPGDQQRFRLAYELGYLMLEMPLDWDCEHIQKATNCFAAAFLVPRTAAFRELGFQRTSLDSSELYSLKHYYGLSMKAWIDRAYDLAVISEDTKQQLVHLFHQRGWHLQELGEKQPSRTNGTTCSPKRAD
ncbi:MAG: ImmA/IrrE family metallo-endopeptidase, partial [Gloeomargarita sp. SKYG98]|nr:ImmA/IrrE family metallo-endopeptidase [Gloeomargarita sp. SKYG98]